MGWGGVGWGGVEGSVHGGCGDGCGNGCGSDRGAYPAVLPCLPVEEGLALRPLAVLSPPNNGRLFFLFGADGMVVVACVGVQDEVGWLVMVWSRKRGPGGSGVAVLATKAAGR